MKKQLTILITGILMATVSLAQTAVSVRDIQYVSPTDLADCKDLSSYDDQEIKTIGIVMHDGNLTEFASGSVNGGYRQGFISWIIHPVAWETLGEFRSMVYTPMEVARVNL